MQLPELSPTRVETLFRDKNKNKDLPSFCWFFYNHQVWNSFRLNDENLNTWQMLPQGEPGIYQIECIQTGKKYIGESKNIQQRFWSTYNTLQQGTHPSNSFQTDWKKFGPQNFFFTILYADERFALKSLRKKVENFFVYENRTNVYNEVSKYGLNNL